MKKILLSIGAIVLALSVSELGLRLAGKEKEIAALQGKIDYLNSREMKRAVSIGTYDEVLGWKYVPDSEDNIVSSEFSVTYKINSRGIRDREHTLEKKQGVLRILALGDSLTFGEGIDLGMRYTDVLEQALKNTDVINMGNQGYGIDQNLLMLEREGFAYRPDFVVLFVSKVGLDRCALYWDNSYKPRFELDESGKKLVLKSAAENMAHFKVQRPSSAPTEQKTREIRFGKSVLLNYVKAVFHKKEVEDKLKARERALWRRLDIRRAVDRNAEKTSGEPFLGVVSLILDRYLIDCRTQGLRFVVVNMGQERLELMEKLCQEKGIAYLDLSGVLDRYSREGKLRFDIDPHYNAFGHRVVGEHTALYFMNEFQLKPDKDFRFRYARQQQRGVEL